MQASFSIKPRYPYYQHQIATLSKADSGTIKSRYYYYLVQIAKLSVLDSRLTLAVWLPLTALLAATA
jgi:uncharacterized protein (DUF2461 family)